LALNLDVAPTVLELAGLAVPARMQGKSLVGLVRDSGARWREDFYCENNFCVPEQYYPRMEGVRTTRWKYVRYPEMNPVFEQLFDLDRDPLETNDLARSPELSAGLARLRGRCDRLRIPLRFAGRGSLHRPSAGPPSIPTSHLECTPIAEMASRGYHHVASELSSE
jgi:arylsulfatase A-like enzyme